MFSCFSLLYFTLFFSLSDTHAAETMQKAANPPLSFVVLPDTAPLQPPPKTVIRKPAKGNTNGNSKYQFIDKIYPEGITQEEFKKLDMEFKSQPEGLKKPSAQAHAYVVGDREVFWTQSNNTYKQLTAECRKVTTEAYIFVVLTDNYYNPVYFNGYNSGYITQTDVDQIGNEFSHIYATDRNAFGNDPVIGLNGESRVTILLLDIDDTCAIKPNTDLFLGGYFSKVDTWTEQYAQSQNRHSNERKIIYIDTYPAIESLTVPNMNHSEPWDFGIEQAYKNVAHEFQHLIHYNMDPYEELWVNEGCSGLAEFICGYDLRMPSNFSKEKNGDSLIDWKSGITDYEQVALFFYYLYEKCGGISTIKDIVANKSTSITGIQNVFTAKEYLFSFNNIFLFWSVANYLDNYSIYNGWFGYYGIDLSQYSFSALTSHSSYPTYGLYTINKWSTQYIEFSNGKPLKILYSSIYNTFVNVLADSMGIITLNVATSEGSAFPNFGNSISKLIMVSNAYENDDFYLYSTSDISSATVTVTAPNGVESWIARTSHNITWTSSGVTNVKIEYSTNNGSSWTTIIASTSASAGSYAWTVPAVNSTQCLIRVSDTLNATVKDQSNAVFTILGTVTVTAPNGGESWIARTSHNITWTSSGVTNVKIKYSINNSSSWTTITASTSASKGTYSWTVPDESSTTCLVKVTDATNEAVTDQSNAVFTIEQIVVYPPSNFIAEDVPNDQGNQAKLTWSVSPSESKNCVSCYKIYRSRSNVLTDPIPLSQFSSLDSLIFYEQHYTILIDSVAAGITEYIDRFVPMNGVPYCYWLQAVWKNIESQKIASGNITFVEDEPSEFQVSAPYPNPFNPYTTIKYQVPIDCHVELVIYDILGRKVSVLQNGQVHAGVHESVWNGKNENGTTVGSGVYLYWLKADKYIRQGKITLMK